MKKAKKKTNKLSLQAKKDDRCKYPWCEMAFVRHTYVINFVCWQEKPEDAFRAFHKITKKKKGKF